ncbi:hypothetical protein ACI78T_13190 [Blastococcus sp. SYSU D00922]
MDFSETARQAAKAAKLFADAPIYPSVPALNIRPLESYTREAIEEGNAQSAELLSSLIEHMAAMQERLDATEAERAKLAWRSWVNLAATLIAAVAAVVALFIAN